MKHFWKFFPFWIFLFLFKFGGSLHYSILSPLGEKVFPLWMVGLLIGAGSLTQLFFDIPIGYLLDRYRYKFFLGLTTLSFLCVGIFLWFGLTPVTYVLNIIFMTFGWMFFGPGSNAYLLSHAPKEHTGTFISFREISNSVGVVLGSAFLAFLLTFPVRTMGVIFSTIFALAFLTLFFIPNDQKKIAPKTRARSQIKTIQYVIQKLNPASTMLLLLGLSSAIFYGVIWFVIPIVIASQTNNQILSLGLGVFDFAVVILGYFLGTLADKLNKRTLVFFGILLFAICGVLLGFNFGLLFLVFGFLATTGEEAAGISLWSWLHVLDHEHAHDGTIASAISLFDDLGWAIGPILAGILFTFLGPTWTIVLGALPIGLTWIIYQLLLTKHKPHINPSGNLAPKPHRSKHRT